MPYILHERSFRKLNGASIPGIFGTEYLMTEEKGLTGRKPPAGAG